ncbi:MAG: AAA family ATPase [Chloroflexi bacterium]|nr:AAA family ATPase [Chloroflexota bacterium]
MINPFMDKQSQPSDPFYRVFLFGVLSIHRGGESIPLPSSTTARNLLAYLLLQRQRIHSRAVLTGIFWPDHSEDRARRALSQAVWHLRSSLPGLIATNGESIGILEEADLWIDIEEFERNVRPRSAPEGKSGAVIDSLNHAIRLYRGDLLEAVYDDWVILERERLRLLHQQILEKLMLLEKSAGHFQEALELGLALVKSDPLHESAHREVMRLQHLLNRPEAALQQFETCQRLLRTELSIDPAPETLALVQEISRRGGEEMAAYLPQGFETRRPVQLGQSHPIHVPLVGRVKERAELLTFVEASLNRQGGLVFVEGETGIGKTRLLQEIARDAEWRGAQVLWGHGSELAASKPYAPVVEAMESGLSSLRVEQLKLVVEPLWLQVLKPLLPKLSTFSPSLVNASPLEPQEEPARLTEAFFRFLKGWMSIIPLVIILEDLHWADPDSLLLLPALLPRLGACGILVICSYRSEEARSNSSVWEKLQALDKSGKPRRISLDRLDPANTVELIHLTLALNSTAPLFENRIYSETDGNPLFVLEVLHTLQDEGLLTRNDQGEWTTPWDETTTDYGELPLPPLVERVIARRLSQLPADDRQVLHSCVILGNRFDITILRAVSRLSTETLLAALRDLSQRHILEETPAAYRFNHEIIRQVAYGEMDNEERIQRHLSVAAALETMYPDQVEVLAHHYTECQEWKKAVHYHHRSADQATSAHAYSTALFHLDTAVALLDKMPPSIPCHLDLLRDREKVQEILGNRQAQSGDLQAMLQLACDDPLRLAEAQSRQAWFFVYTNRYAEADMTAHQALELARQAGDATLQAVALSILGTICNWRGQIAESIPLLQEAIALSGQAEGKETELQYRRALANALLGLKDYAAALHELDHALDVARQEHDPLGEVETLNLLGILHMEKGELAEATSAYEEALNLSRKLGYLYGEARSLVNLGTLFYFQAKMGRMLDCYDGAIAIFRHIQSRRGEAQVCLNRASISLTFLGDTLQASADAEVALAYYRQIGDALSEGQGLIVLAESHRQQGNLPQALRHARKGLKMLEKAGEHFLAVQAERELAMVELEAGQALAAKKHLDHAMGDCRQYGLTDLEPPIICLRALALLKEGETRAALQSSREAMARLKPGIEQAYLIPFWHSQVLEAAGRTPEAQDAVQQAYDLLQQALEEFSPEQRGLSLEGVPEHRLIVAAWQALAPSRVSVDLPSLENQAERVAVTWTVDCLEDRRIKGRVAQRQRRLLRLLSEAHKQGAAPTHQNLADALGVGLRTVERDIALLEQKNTQKTGGVD